MGTRISMAIALMSLVGLVACAESGFSAVDDTRGGEFDDGNPDGVDGQLRIDVYPSQSAELFDSRGAALDLRPQTFIAEVQSSSDLVLNLTPAVQVGGLVEGTALTPWPSAELPTVDGILGDAEIRFSLEGTIQQPRTTSDADGTYEVPVVPSDLAYEVAVIPAEADVPIRVQRMTIDGSTRSVDLSVDAGVPVWGTIVDETGAAMANLSVSAVDDRGLRSMPVRTDGLGRFQIIVAEGQPYWVEAGPSDGAILPTLRQRLDVVESNGANADASYGNTTASTVTGLVRTPRSDGGEPEEISDGVVRIRLVATSLDGFDDGEASYSVEVPTSGGRFTTIAPRGNYRVEVVPQANEGPSPLIVEDVRVGTSTTTVNGLDLERKIAREGLVVDSFGSTVGGAEVTCTEDGFAERTFSTTADPNGAFVMLVPLSPMVCTVTPPQGMALASTRQRIPESDALDDAAVWTLQAREGSIVRGRLLARRSVDLTAVADAPVSSAVVQVRAGDLLMGVAISDADGNFEVRIDR